MTMKRAVSVLAVMILSVGVAMAQTEWTDHPDNPVLDVDDVGPWAPGGAWATSVLLDGTTYHMWFTGFSEDGGYSNSAIGHATSSDGVEWTMDPANPVLTPGPDGDWDDEFALGPAVVHDAAGYHMWYTGHDGELEHLGYATSDDGSEWTKHGPVLESGPPGAWDHLIGPSAVVVVDGKYKMWFYGSNGSDYNGQIGYAESQNGIDWTKWADPVLEPNRYPGSWEVQFLQPTVVFYGTTYHLWYGGNSPTDWAKIGYAFSADGIEWTQHRGNPVHAFPGENISPVVVLDGTTFHMWYLRFGWPSGQAGTAYATSDTSSPGRPALDNWQFIPAAAVASGAEGAFYQTDVDVGNGDDRMVEYVFEWLPRSEDNTERTSSDVFTLDAGNCTRYSNVLAEVFGHEPNSFGALVIRSTSPDLMAMSRTYNLGTEKAGGTFGQAMAAIPPDEFIGQHETRRLLFGTENADMRTNVGCQNGGISTAAVFLELFDSEGTSLARPYVMLQPLGNDQINRIFDGHNPVNGYIEISSPSPNASYYCYGSVLDNVTSDPTTIPPQ